MRDFAKARCAILSAAMLLPFAATAPASAFSGPGLRAAVIDTPTAVVKVSDRWADDDEDRDHRWHRHHRHHYDEVVDAPFTHVQSGHRVIVDAPFAHVAVGRYGRHVVAPFVDLWVPR